MITPRFQLSQTDSELSITIYASYCMISDTEINIEENIFLFYSSPYFLRLTLPGKLIDSEKEVHKITFDADQKSFTVQCMKQTFGEYFPGLDMLTALLTPKGLDSIKKPSIEVLGQENTNDSDDEEEEEEEEFDWFYEQKLPEEVSTEGFKYGFNNSHSNVFLSLKSEMSSLVSVADPDLKCAAQRRKERLEQEKEAFDENRYLSDLYDSEYLHPALEFEPLFYKTSKEELEYTTEEQDRLLQLPRREILVDKGSQASIYFTLVDLVFSWCYNHRITEGKNCVESAWNLSQLSSTLSWLDSFHSLKEVAKSSMRRSVVYPLVRNWKLSLSVLQDTIQVLSVGKKQVLKCLLETHKIYSNSCMYYLFNDLYITDYCLWVQTISDDKLTSLADSLKKVSVSKEDMELELIELEAAAEMVILEEEEANAGENLNNVMASFDHLSVIENSFALSRNDNATQSNPVPLIMAPAVNGHSISDDSSDDDSSSSSSSSSSSDGEDSTSSSDDSDSESDTDSSSGTSSLDSDDDRVAS